MDHNDPQIGFYTPCCTRKVRGVPFTEHAVLAVRRTCPKCRKRWHVLAEPLGAMAGGFAHALTWARPSRGLRGPAEIKSA